MIYSRSKFVDINKTIDLIKVLHAGQYDWTGTEYWKHPFHVMNILPSNSSNERKCIALLHDVLEDCLPTIAKIIDIDPENINESIGAQYLLDLGYSEHVVKGVGLLTRDTKNNITYINEIRNIIDSCHIDAIWSKLCDNTHNTDPERIELLKPEDKKRVLEMGQNRYEKSKELLRRGIIALTPSTIIYEEDDDFITKNIKPLSMRRGSSEKYSETQWLLQAYDNVRNIEIELAFNKIF